MAIVDYDREFWCTFGGHKVKRGEEKSNKRGQPICPNCGKRLRFKVRNKHESG